MADEQRYVRDAQASLILCGHIVVRATDDEGNLVVAVLAHLRIARVVNKDSFHLLNVFVSLSVLAMTCLRRLRDGENLTCRRSVFVVCCLLVGAGRNWSSVASYASVSSGVGHFVVLSLAAPTVTPLSVSTLR